MKIQFHIRGLNLNPGFRRQFEQTFEGLQSLIAISDAAVVLEHRRDDALPFRAYISLAVPGPDIHAAARAHTLEAAWLKVTEGLRKQIERRQSRRRARAKSKRQMPLSTSRWGGGLVGARG
jgi:ribosome-associated translation inhibitor RaiA